MTSSPSVSLTAEQIQDLNKQLSTMRHDINNCLSLVLAAAEVIRRKPEAVERMTGTLTDQPRKVTDAMQKFSASFEIALGIAKA
jgi:hypothetical protein